MELSEFATHLTRFIYLAVAVITLFEYVAHRDETRLDIALMMGSFAVTVVAQEYAALTGSEGAWVGLAASLPLVAQPFLLVRLVGHFRPVPLGVQRTALAGLVVSWLAIFWTQVAQPVRPPLVITLMMVAYFVWAEGYAAVSFVRGARATGGVTHWRLLFAALGSAMVAFVILSAGVLAVPGLLALAPPFLILNQLLGIGSALAFYFGFAAPRWLRHTWQLDELHRFLGAAAGKPAPERAAWIVGVLCETTMRAVGGRGALAMAWDAAENQFVVRAATTPAWLGLRLMPQPGAMLSAWHSRRAVLGRTLSELSPEGRELAKGAGASSLLAVPIGTSERQWGLLVALMRRASLFPDDDLNLLSLFSEQAALALEQAALLDEQRVLVDSLRTRTAQLEATNAELEAFSYSVSHDLRAPLRHIEGFTDLMRREGTTPEQQRHHLQRISEAAVRMGRLIDDLLTFSRMGRAELRRVPLALDELVHDVRSDLHTETRGREIVWHLRPLPSVEGDPDLLRLVVYNLLANAVKYTRGQNPAEIEVGTAPGAADEVVVYVRDNGVGFDMRYVDKLFGVFQRLHHQDEFEGVGIGLANVRRIVARHGGRTWAESRPGAGATFYFSLPVRPSLAAAPPAPAFSLPAVAATPPAAAVHQAEPI